MRGGMFIYFFTLLPVLSRGQFLSCRMRNEVLNNFTIRSLATMVRARSDVYGGDFGRVNITKADL